jgi:hypothetical protein
MDNDDDDDDDDDTIRSAADQRPDTGKYHVQNGRIFKNHWPTKLWSTFSGTANNYIAPSHCFRIHTPAEAMPRSS